MLSSPNRWPEHRCWRDLVKRYSQVLGVQSAILRNEPANACQIQWTAIKITADMDLHQPLGHLYTIHMDGFKGCLKMPSNLHELRSRAVDTEKITINLGFIDLGHIDLMVQEGFYSNRTDFIRTAIRSQIDRHADVVKNTVARQTLDLGLRHYTRADLEEATAARQQLHLHVLGLLSLAADVTPELARAAIASITILGALHASPEVKAALADRIR